MHSLMSLFTLWAIMGFYRIARLINPELALVATAFFGLSPGVVVGQNTMVDVPLLAVWIEFYRILLDPTITSRRRYIFSALLCSAALLIKYTSLVLVFALFFHFSLKRDWRYLPYVLLPLLTLAAWSIFNFHEYGGIHILDRPVSNFAPDKILNSALIWTITIGGISPFAIWAVSGFLASMHNRILSYLGYLIFALCIAFYGLIMISPVTTISGEHVNMLLKPYFLVCGLGLILATFAVLIVRIRENQFSTEDLLLTYWFLYSAFFIILFSPFMATRHTLLAIPPVLLILITRVNMSAPRAITGATIAISLFLSSTLASADAWYADIYRQAASRIMNTIKESNANNANNKIWFGGTWGWQWYATQAGMNQLSLRENPKIGDWIITPKNTFFAMEHIRGLKLSHVREIVVRRDEWLQHFAHISFYDSSHATLPWMVSKVPIEIFRVSRVIANGSGRGNLP